MIPRAITVRGFLCYKDEQVIDLDGCDLWVFAGRNGSGKSAIFDAVTFALFGAHRGGKRDAASLIRSDADEMSVVFEFDLGPGRYRIRRSLRRRGRPAVHVARFEPEDDGPGRWPVVPQTEGDTGLRRWVQEHVGLTYETFTASVLLLQGRAETLLGADPRERHRILASIVDLESYDRLHKRAEERRQRARVLAESLRSGLQAMPVIEPVAIEEAERQLIEAEAGRAAAEAEWKRLIALQAQVATWLDLAGRRERASATREHARRLIADSEAIAREWSRLQELEAVLPSVRDAIARREAIARFEARARRGEEERKASSRKLDLMTALAEDNRRHLEAIAEEIGRDEARVRAILERQTALASPIQRLRQARAQGEEVRRLEGVLASYPADLAAAVADLEEELRRRDGWKAVLPSLEALARERGRLAEARSRQLSAQRAIDAGTAAASQATAEFAVRRADESAARVAEGRARDRATEAATLAREAEGRLARFEDLNGATTCERCGQALTPEHFVVEAARLRTERDQTAQAARDADRAHRDSKDRLDAAATARAAAEGSLREAERAIEAARSDLSQAGRDADHHARACSDAYERLDDPFRIRVAAGPPDDWAITTFPEAADLEEARRLAAGVDEVRSRSHAAHARLVAKEADRTRLEQARRALAAVGLGPGDEAAEAEDAALQAERESLARCLEGHATERALAEQTQARLDEHARDLRGRLAEAEGTLATSRAHSEALRAEATRARAAIPEGWRASLDTATEADLAAWDEECRSLRACGLEALAAELPQAHLLLGQVETDLADLGRQIADLPEEACRDPAELAPGIDQAEHRRQQAETARQARQDERNALRRSHEQRLDVQARSVAAERDLAVAETLSRLLGPRGLQRDLIRGAERGIVALANPILREISGGELELRLLDPGDDAPDHALQLEAVERVHGRTGARGVEYLSGSQKFRVAVSLALAIGQYARGSKERPIESVIIDEGFGSLDRQGRDEMIEQLNALRGRLARIILVSHQEEFAEAFRDGYRFEVIEGSTVARPFHR